MNENESEIQDPVDLNHSNSNNNNANKCKTQLDLSFVLDCTGSMNPYIRSAQENIINIANKISEEEHCDARFAVVAYRDIPPQEDTFITDIVHFTSVPLIIQLKLNTLKAYGGGDPPEALSTALYKVRHVLKWRKEAIKIIIVIGDAPPHGIEIEAKVDGFPDGDPIVDHDTTNDKYYNVIQIINSIQNELNASIYSVGCEPTLSCSFDFARDFYEYMSHVTHGKFLPLSDAQLLPKVVIGSIKEQIMNHELMQQLDEEMKSIKNEYGDDIDDSKMNELIAARWKKNGVEHKTVSIGSLYRCERSRDNIDLLMNDQIVKSLSDFKKYCKVFERAKRSDFRHLDTHKKICGKKSARNSNLKAGFTPYVCSFCHREFEQQHSLMKHMRAHTGEKPYQCSACFKRFTQTGSLNAHLMKVHKVSMESRSMSRSRSRSRGRSSSCDRSESRERERDNKKRNRSRFRSRSRSPQRVYLKTQSVSNKDVDRVVMQWKSKNQRK